MPARPSWSRGCDSCRRLKVKCDETKPECQRCRKAKRSCPGYEGQGQTQYQFVNFTARTESNPHSRGRPENNVQYNPLTLMKPSTQWRQFATAKFIEDYTTQPAFGAPGYLEFLPEILRIPSPCLQEAFLSASFASLGNVARMPSLQSQSWAHYGAALRSLATALNEPTTAMADQTLAAILLIQKFEIISGIRQLPTTAHASIAMHDSAIAEIANQRWPGKPKNPVGVGLHRVVHARAGIREVCDGSPGGKLRPNGSIYQNSVLGSSLWPLLLDVSTCRSDIQSAITSKSATPSKGAVDLQYVLQNSVTLFNRLIAWPTSVSEEWKYGAIHTPSPTDSAPDDDGRIFYFRSLQHGAVWMLYWTTSIHLLQSLTKGYETLFADSQRNKTNQDEALTMAWINEKLLETVDDLISCAPYLLGDIDTRGQICIGKKSKALGAFFLFRGLMTANSVDNLRLQQRLMILEFLDRIAGSFGISMASKFRNQWINDHPYDARLHANSY